MFCPYRDLYGFVDMNSSKTSQYIHSHLTCLVPDDGRMTKIIATEKNLSAYVLRRLKAIFRNDTNKFLQKQGKFSHLNIPMLRPLEAYYLC
jgi:hypothetical protein